MPDEPPDDPIREETDRVDETPGRAFLARLREAFPIAWKHDELFRYALVLSILAWLVILSHAGSNAGHYR